MQSFLVSLPHQHGTTVSLETSPFMNLSAILIMIFAVSEASSDTIFNNSRTKRVPADDENPVLADIIGSQTKILWAG